MLTTPWLMLTEITFCASCRYPTASKALSKTVSMVTIPYVVSLKYAEMVEDYMLEAVIICFSKEFIIRVGETFFGYDTNFV